MMTGGRAKTVHLVAGSENSRRPCLIVYFNNIPSWAKDLPLGPATPQYFQTHGLLGRHSGSKVQQCSLVTLRDLLPGPLKATVVVKSV